MWHILVPSVQHKATACLTRLYWLQRKQHVQNECSYVHTFISDWMCVAHKLICSYVRMCKCSYVHIVCLHVHMCRCSHGHMYIYSNVQMYICLEIQICGSSYVWFSDVYVFCSCNAVKSIIICKTNKKIQVSCEKIFYFPVLNSFTTHITQNPTTLRWSTDLVRALASS